MAAAAQRPQGVHGFVPVIYYDPVQASEAFAVHATMVKAEIAFPDLANFEHWREQRDIAFARFCAAFEAA
jgi:hypothetical protein